MTPRRENSRDRTEHPNRGSRSDMYSFHTTKTRVPGTAELAEQDSDPLHQPGFYSELIEDLQAIR